MLKETDVDFTEKEKAKLPEMGAAEAMKTLTRALPKMVEERIAILEKLVEGLSIQSSDSVGVTIALNDATPKMISETLEAVKAAQNRVSSINIK